MLSDEAFNWTKEDVADFLVYVYADAREKGFVFREIDANEPCAFGNYKVALLFEPSAKDFHWYRQNKDGTWSHKPGKGAEIINYGGTADNPTTIWEPCKAATNPISAGLNYSEFGGYYEVSGYGELYDPNHPLVQNGDVFAGELSNK